MKLILTDDNGTVLDSTEVRPHEWKRAESSATLAQGILMSLDPGAEVESP
jgi:hypothetical protein